MMENNNVQEFFDLLDVDSIEEFDSCESGFLAKKNLWKESANI